MLAVIAIALLVRIAAAVVLAIHGGYTIPDEGQYVGLARSVADGHGADAWFPGYGQSLYNSTYAFSALLADLFRVFGVHRILGQLIAVLFGGVTAAAATWLARRLVGSGWALLAGLVVAVMPSQVLWSSVVLRESMVWASCAVTAAGAVLLATAATRRRLGIAVVISAAGLLLVGFLREQTLAVAALALVLALFVCHVSRPVIGRLLGVSVALLTTIAAGIGPLGYGLAARAFPALPLKQLNLSIGAKTSFVNHQPVTPAPTPSATPPVGSGGNQPAPDRSAAPQASDGGNGNKLVNASGHTYAISDSTASYALSEFPTGIVAVTVRPYPWEATTSLPMRFAKLEDILWVGLYGLAVLGVWAGRHRREVIAYPTLFIVGIFLLGAITQGNLGTAFRHRGQVLWALAPLAALGLHWLLMRVRSRRHSPAVA